jgi:hypothetical protein
MALTLTQQQQRQQLSVHHEDAAAADQGQDIRGKGNKGTCSMCR